MQQGTLFPTGPTARPTDPPTSTAAGAALTLANLSTLQERVLSVHRRFVGSGLTDDELCRELDDRYAPTVIKRRTELVKAGILRDTGRRRRTRRLREAVVWGVA